MQFARPDSHEDQVRVVSRSGHLHLAPQALEPQTGQAKVVDFDPPTDLLLEPAREPVFQRNPHAEHERIAEDQDAVAARLLRWLEGAVAKAGIVDLPGLAVDHRGRARPENRPEIRIGGWRPQSRERGHRHRGVARDAEERIASEVARTKEQLTAHEHADAAHDERHEQPAEARQSRREQEGQRPQPRQREQFAPGVGRDHAEPTHRQIRDERRREDQVLPVGVPDRGEQRRTPQRAASAARYITVRHAAFGRAASELKVDELLLRSQRRLKEDPVGKS